MAAAAAPQCVGPSYHLEDRKAAIQASINCFPKRLEGDKWMLKGAEGTTTIVTLAGEVRDSRYCFGRWFVVASNVLYEVETDGTTVNRGSLITGTGYVCMANNQTQLGIVDGANYYVFTFSSNDFQQITVAGWRGSDNIQEMDGYFIFSAPNTDQFYISAIDDGTVLNPLDFSSADAQPDNISTFRVNHHQLFLFGDEKSTEIWVDSGGAAFPFTRYTSYPVDIACVGKGAAINAADTLFFIGKSERGTAVVYSISGNSPIPVSNSAVEEALLTSTDLSAATLWTYQISGHEFIGINAPGLTTTWVYDARQKLWHERGEWVDGEWQPLKWVTVTAVENEHYAGCSNGELCLIDDSAYTLSGRTLARERVWPHLVRPSLELVYYNSLELHTQTGLVEGQIALQISNDGGFTWNDPILKNLGVTGRWMQRIRWLRLGASFDRVFKIRVTDPVPFAIYNAAVAT